MAKNDNLNDFLENIANKFRSKLEIADLINPQDFDIKIDEVYEKCDENFWAKFQKVINGTAERKNYNNAFINWYTAEIKPKFAVANAKTDWRQAFYGNTLLARIDFSGWTYMTNDVAKTDTMFYNCQSLTSLDWNKNFGFAPVSANQMFLNCSNLKTITNFNIGNLTNVSKMFSGCTALENFDFTGSIIADGLDFHNSTKLKGVDYIINNLDGMYSEEPPTVSRTIIFDIGAPDRVIEEQQIDIGYWDWLVSEAAKANWSISLL